MSGCMMNHHILPITNLYFCSKLQAICEWFSALKTAFGFSFVGPVCHWYDSVRVQSRMSLVYASYVYVFMYSRLAIWWTSTLQVFGVPASVSRKCKETLWSPTCHEGNSSDSKSWSEHHEMIEMVLTTYYKSDDQWPFHVESPFEHPNLKSLYKCFFFTELSSCFQDSCQPYLDQWWNEWHQSSCEWSLRGKVFDHPCHGQIVL